MAQIKTKLAYGVSGTLPTANIADDAITSAKIADNAVVTAAINADAVTDAKIADDVVGTEHLTAGEVDTTALGADSVNATKIADDSISDEHLDNTAITGQTAITSLADTDKFLVSDASDSNNLKYVEKQYLPSGAMTLIHQERSDSTASNVSFVQKFTSSYYMYKLIGIVSSYDNNVILKARFLNNTTEQDGAYYRHLWNAGRIDTSNSISASRVGNQAESFASLSDGQAQNNADSPLHLDLTFYDPARAMGGFSSYNGNISWINVNGKFTVGTAGAVYRNSTTIDGFRIYASSGNVRYYDLKLYGLANA